MLVEDLLERDFAVQLAVQGDEDSAQAPLGVRTKNAKPQAVAGGRANGVCGGELGVRIGILPGRGRADADQAGCDGGLADRGQALAGRAAGGDGGQAFFDVVAVLRQVPGDQGLDGNTVVGVEAAPVDQVIGQRPGLVASPGGECREQRPLVDQAILQGQQAEQQVTRRVSRSGHGGGSHSHSIEGPTMPMQAGRAEAGLHRL